MKRIGLMGCGVVAQYGHLPVISQTPGLQLSSVFDPNPANLRATIERYPQVQTFSDVEAFFGSAIDAVVITSPAPAHRENVLQCARHRLPVLCEKPLAMAGAEAEEMIAAMESAGVPLFVGFTYRFSPVAMKIRDLLRAGAIGEVRSLRLIYIWDCHGACSPRTAQGQVNQRRLGRMLEGGPMVDCGVHQIDLARWWLGRDVVRQSGVGIWIEQHAAPDHMYLHLDHEGGAHTMVEMSYSYSHTSAEPRSRFIYELIGTDGLIRFDRNHQTFEMVTAAGTETFAFANEKNFGGMYVAFERALRTGEPGDLASAREAMIATHIARSATDAAIHERTKQFAAIG
jgi:predicted dehydrogenase